MNEDKKAVGTQSKDGCVMDRNRVVSSIAASLIGYAKGKEYYRLH